MHINKKSYGIWILYFNWQKTWKGNCISQADWDANFAPEPTEPPVEACTDYESVDAEDIIDTVSSIFNLIISALTRTTFVKNSAIHLAKSDGSLNFTGWSPVVRKEFTIIEYE